MNRKSLGCLGAVIPLAIVACVSLAIVGGIVTWMAAREGNSPDELVIEMLRGRQPARAVLPQSTRRATDNIKHKGSAQNYRVMPRQI